MQYRFASLSLVFAFCVGFLTPTAKAEDANAAKEAQSATEVPASTPDANAPSPEQLRYFESHVRPLLVEKCLECHSGDEPDGGLLMNGLASLLAGGESGPAVEPGNADASLLIEAVRYESYEMPPSGKLSDREIQVLEKWVADGAVWPGGHEARPKAERITDEDRSFWAFQPVVDPKPPASGEGWAKSAIDRFVAQKLQNEGLEPNEPADKRVLVQRVYQTVIGLPPTPEQVDAFINNDSPSAYADLVDELLASPRHGEHAASFWLDVVRFADTDGYRADHYRPNAWRYRDYVIKSFNEDKSYKQFVAEQLAGDELFPNDLDAHVATGFMKHSIYEHNQRDVRGQRAVMLADITDTTGDAFLGLGMGCARCHDHKFDPILQRDYYRLQAFFANISFSGENTLATSEQRVEHEQAVAKWKAAGAEILKQIEDVQKKAKASARKRTLGLFTEELQGVYNTPESERTSDEQQIAELMHRQIEGKEGAVKYGKEDQAKIKELEEELAAIAGTKPKALASADIVSDVGHTAPVVFIPGKERLGEVKPGFLTVLHNEPIKVEPIPEVPHTTGRRATLARWLTRDDHPLTPRVMVNRIWQQHFGVGLVATVSDFGHLGEKPSHPELLDYLTSRFIESGWSLKELRRAILVSATFQQSSDLSPAKQQQVAMLDPQNRLLSYFPMRRLKAEQIRDAMLLASGELKLDGKGGPGVDGNTPKRSVFMKVRRNSHDHVLAAFDFPDRMMSVGSRNPTMTPTQALLLINNSWATSRAVAMAKRVEKSDDPVGALYRRTYGREPSDLERTEADQYLETYTLPPLAHILLNTNEFLFLE